MELKRRIYNELSKLRDLIRENLEQKNVNASGNTSKSIEVEEYKEGVRLAGGGPKCAPLFTLEKGRPAGAVPFAGVFFKWSKDKGIDFPDDKARWSFAYAVRAKIQKEGTDRYHNNIDIFTNATQETADRIASEIGAAVEEILKV